MSKELNRSLTDDLEDDLITFYKGNDIDPDEVDTQTLLDNLQDTIWDWISDMAKWAQTESANEALPGVRNGADSPFMNFVLQIIGGER